MTNYTLGIIGASGKFGSRIFSLAKNEEKIGSVLGSKRNPTSPFIPLEELFEKSDVIIDVSSWEGMQDHINLAISHNKPLLIGTTGHPFDIEIILKKASERIPIFYASNFSTAVTLLAGVIKKISNTFPSKKVKIEETHHKGKKDAPSGTALYLAGHIQGGAPPAMVSHRVEDVVFEHQITFFYEQEEITLTHKAFSRDLFAKGALLAGHFMYGQTPGVYHMQDLLNSF